MIKVLVWRQSARGDNDDLPPRYVVPHHLDDPVSRDVREVVVAQVLAQG